MTFSIVAHDAGSGQLGAAALTHMLSVGSLVTWVRPGVGAAVTQAFVNPYLALDAFDQLERGRNVQAALDEVIGADPRREGRQFALVDVRDDTAVWTGDAPRDWKGHRSGTGWSVQGNRLVGPEVVEAAAEALTRDVERSLVQRLLDALEAGEREGGDRKGHRSANLVVVGSEAYPLWDLRVDYAQDVMAEFRNVYETVRGDLYPEILKMPTREDPASELDFGADEQTA
jgi:uncharacterized Ntn-hydrolase superfamily protein